MKLLTLWQPWASLVAIGAKRFETRSWRTDYRGPVAIHASKHSMQWRDASLATWEIAAQALGLPGPSSDDVDPTAPGGPPWRLPLGSVVAVARLTAVWRVQERTDLNHRDLEAGLVCPKCLRFEVETTTMGTLAGERDTNRAWCRSRGCGWSGKAFELANPAAMLELVDSKDMPHQAAGIGPMEAAFGNMKVGRFLWQLEDRIAIDPISTAGRQGLASISVELAGEIMLALRRARARIGMAEARDVLFSRYVLDAEPAVIAATADLPAIAEHGRIHHERACRSCGCTESRACLGGCYWVEADLCSVCADTASSRPPAPRFVVPHSSEGGAP